MSESCGDLADGVDVVYDATNLDYKRRMGFVQRVDAMRLPALYKVCVFYGNTL